ncbi:hypothetical protein PG994_006615 [Apiospora phragmitis]|uniref:MFS transporter n=1 Tax=Apiospora phragmitis TaxID=2905665 RepID=A0ABR1VFK2_9PEZI
MSVAQRRAAPESVDLGLRDSPAAPPRTTTQSSSPPPRKSAKWSTISYDAFAYNASTFLRAAQVGFAIFVCAVASGIVCGFAALKPVLIAEGVYSDLCPPDWASMPCAAQDMRLNLFFILASVTLNVSTIFAGFTLDKRGRRTCYLIAAAVLAVGSLLMAAAFTKSRVIPSWLDGYLVGNLLLGLGGTYIFVPSFQLANAFPRYTGVVMALVTGAFDASAAVFLFYRMAYEASGGRLKPQHFFLAYLIVPVLIVLAELSFMPAHAYHAMPQIQDRLDRAKTARYDAHSSDDELDTDAQRRAARAGRAQARHAKVKRIETVAGGSRERRKREDRLERRQEASGVWGVLHGLPVGRQMATPWFGLILILTMLQMLRMNYFIATLRAQYQYMLGEDLVAARRINEFFDVALPVAGVASTPLIGLILNEFSVTVILAVLSALIVGLGVLNCLPYVWAGYLTVVAFVLFRPLYYSTMSDYVTKVFGFATFGRIYGTITCASGLSNIIQPALDALTHGPLDGNPVPINVFFAASGTVVSVSLTLYVYFQSRAFQQKQHPNQQVGEGEEDEDGERAMLPYFQYYSTQCLQFLLDGGLHVSVSTHNDIVRLANMVLQTRARGDILQSHAASSFGDTDAANCAINLCARLLLMVAVGDPPNGLPGPRTLHWDSGTIVDFTERCFGAQQEQQLNPENAQISKMLTALNLWTPNLADHLRLVDDDRKILVFSCLSFLQFQNRHAVTSKPSQPLFPAGFLDETLRIFSLLFPQNDAATQKWLGAQISKGQGRDLVLDPAMLHCGSLWTHERRYESFRYWNNRLVILKQALDDARPQTMMQWWHDRRNGVQWYTF